MESAQGCVAVIRYSFAETKPKPTRRKKMNVAQIQEWLTTIERCMMDEALAETALEYIRMLQAEINAWAATQEAVINYYNQERG